MTSVNERTFRVERIRGVVRVPLVLRLWYAWHRLRLGRVGRALDDSIQEEFLRHVFGQPVCVTPLSEGCCCGTHTCTSECKAVLFHGPGHQSRTHCRVRGPHELHEAVYGTQYAEWRGGDATTGFFDEPPREEDE